MIRIHKERCIIYTLDNDIKAKSVRLVGVEGYSVVSLDTALNLAKQRNLNLVTMNDQEIPVCKIMDFQKFKYEQNKKQKQSKASKVELKEVKFNPVIADHDLEIKAKTASRILNEGDKVKVTITYRGRIISIINSGIDKLNEFEALVEAKHKVDKPPVIEGNRVYMVISPMK